MMKSFQRCCLGISAQESARTIGTKIANSTVGKSTRPAGLRSGDARESPGVTGGGTARFGGLIAVALIVTLSLVVTPAAHAGCGGVETASPKHKIAPRPPLA